MKTRNIFISLLLAVLCAAPINARQFEQGEKIYVNADQSFHDGNGNYNWAKDGAKLFLYVWDKDNKDKSKAWVALTSEKDNIYAGSMPKGEYNMCIVTRQSGAPANADDWSKKWNQTGDLGIPTKDDKGNLIFDRNFIQKFWDGGVAADWLTYTPDASKIAADAAALRSAGKEETIVVCPSALNGPFSLRVKLTADKKAYDYESVTCHGWFKSTNGTSWTSVDNYAGVARDGEQDKDILKNNLPSSGTVIYYYLHSSKTAGRRLIKVTTDGAKDCDLDCTITFFGVACSEVNANDTTYTLDGMVAFGEPCGDLVITCDGKEARIKASEAHSPQTFSIPGLKAATKSGTTTTATAKFTGDNTRSKQVTVNIPNATQGITYKHIDLLVGETTPLTPSVTPNYDNKHIWYIDGEEQTSMHGQQSSTPINEPNTTKYTYREFNPPAGDMNNLMSNGSYEDEFDYGTKGQKSTISDYNFWGKYAQTDATPIDFYTNATINPDKWSDNGFAVVKNANNFFYTFAKITARDKEFFALFDAASDGVADKKAWKAETAKNPNLKLQKGTTYLFSFWAANINNYGEMDNAAKLQFQISYNGKTEKLGEVLDLDSAAFRNNRWHQCSATFYADADASNVTISVVNLNTNKLNTGNDFALDDIQFRAVSSATRSVRIQQVFEVQTHEPHIYSFKATPQSMACGVKEYDVKLVVEYDNPKGNLVIKDLTANKEVFNAAVPTQNADWDKKKSKTVTYHISSLEPAKHEYKVYFAGWEKATATASSTSPVFRKCGDIVLTAEVQPMECDETSFDVKVIVDYINPKGNLVIEDESTGKKLFNEAVPAGELNEQMTKDDIVVHINSLTPAERKLKAYFAQLPDKYDEVSITSPEFTKCCTDGLIFRKWNNVLFVNNGDSSIVAYQWYKNDAKLDGETLQHLYTRATPMAGTTDLYHCVVTRKDGTEETLCEFTFDEFPSSAEASQAVAASVSVRPTRVPAGEAITITKSADETLQATLLTVTGQTVTATSISDNESTMLVPHEPGLYLLKLQGTTIQSTVKINVF